jgi:hypothetical protein
MMHLSRPSKEHMQRVLEEEYRVVATRLLVHKRDMAKAAEHATAGTYNGILYSGLIQPDPVDIEEIITHEQECAFGGYINWDEHPEARAAKEAGKRQWVMLACVEKRGTGQRFFSTRGGFPGSSDLWICDNSGPNPDSTDDGPLRLDTKRKVQVGTTDGAGTLYAMIPVIGERHASEGSRCGVTIRELLWLVRHGWIKPDRIEVADALKPLIELFQVTWPGKYRVPQGPESGVAAIVGTWPGDEEDETP